MKKFLLPLFFVLAGVALTHATEHRLFLVAVDPVAGQTDASSAAGSGDTNAAPAVTTDDPADGGQDDMSPDEVQVWDWLKQNGVYVAIGLGVLLLFLHGVSRPPET